MQAVPFIASFRLSMLIILSSAGIHRIFVNFSAGTEPRDFPYLSAHDAATGCFSANSF
jgi:hypothetical protein